MENKCNIPLYGEDYIVARKVGDKWRLYYRGTKNEVFLGELFYSAREARQYYRVMQIKMRESSV